MIMMHKLLMSIAFGLILTVSSTYPKGTWERNSGGIHEGNNKKRQHEYDSALSRRQAKEDHASLASQEANRAKQEAVQAAAALVEASEEKVKCAQRKLDIDKKELEDARANAAIQFKPVRVDLPASMMMDN